MISLGCAKNLVDGEVMLGHLVEHGAEITSDLDAAEVVVVNTCGFVEDAKRESIEAILDVAARKGEGKLRRLVVAGCMAQRFAAELQAEIPEVDAFLGLDELQRAPAAVFGTVDATRLPEQRGAASLYDHTSPRLLATGGVFAYLKVAEGCSNPCSFCSIPRMRGEFRSRPLASLVAEAQRLEAAGVREIVLIAQDTTRYGEDLGMGRSGLVRLLEALLAATSVPWLRVMYAYPSTLQDAVFRLMAREPRLVPYLDLPFQHAAGRVLRAMRRAGSRKQYADQIARGRDMVPELAVRSTFIVGFPGEGEAEFAELQRFVDEVRFDALGVFAYSWQEENPGAGLGDPVPRRVKMARLRVLMRQQERITREIHRSLRGRELVALVEGTAPESELLRQGRLARQAPEVDARVVFTSGEANPGDLVRVRVRRTSAHDLAADILEVLQPAPARTLLVPAPDRLPRQGVG